jgi:hypothetical protein
LNEIILLDPLIQNSSIFHFAVFGHWAHWAFNFCLPVVHNFAHHHPWTPPPWDGNWEV